MSSNVKENFCQFNVLAFRCFKVSLPGDKLMALILSSSVEKVDERGLRH